MNVEHFLARLYTDAAFRDRFIAAPRDVAVDSGASADEANELAAIDVESLRLAARSFEKKRSKRRA